jgi:hypothetical protein
VVSGPLLFNPAIHASVYDMVTEKITEKQVVRVWQYQLLDRTGLATEDGLPLEILYPGRPNDDRGADFRDAVVATNRIRQQGDVEIHVKSSDWHRHGHDRDAFYNRVILHVVMRHDRRGNTVLENGGQVPVLALEKYLHSASPGPPCGKAGPAAIVSFLDDAGDERFHAKANKFRVQLDQTDAAQVLYEGIMEALGYAKNKVPFLELARRLPLEVIESTAKSEIRNQEAVIHLQSLLLDTAVEISGWNTFKIRPCNGPSHRIIAMSRLLARYRKQGILEALTGKTMQVQNHRDKKAFNTLENAFIVATGSRNGNPFTWLGRERAADIIVNVLLPFCEAFGRKAKLAGLTRQARELYRAYPGQTPNSIVNHMTGQLGLVRKHVNTARRQQGLLHVYKENCIQGRCRECSLTQLEAGVGIKVQAVSFAGHKTIVAASRHHSGVVGAQPDRRNGYGDGRVS